MKVTVNFGALPFRMPELIVFLPFWSCRPRGVSAFGLNWISGVVPPHQYGAPAGSLNGGFSVLDGPKGAGSGFSLPFFVTTTVWKPRMVHWTLSPLLTVTWCGYCAMNSVGGLFAKLPQSAFAVAALARLGTRSAAPTAPAPDEHEASPP